MMKISIVMELPRKAFAIDRRFSPTTNNPDGW